MDGRIDDIIDVSAIEKQIDAVVDLIDWLARKTDDAAKAMRNMMSEVGKSTQMKELDELAKKFNSTLSSLISVMDKQAEAIKKLSQLEQQSVQAVEHNTRVTNEHTIAMDKDGSAAKDAAKNYNVLFKGIENFDGVMKKTLGTFSENARQLNRLEENLKGLRKGYEDGKISKQDFLEQEAQIKQAISQTGIILEEQTKELNAAGGSMTELSARLGLMRKAYRDLTEEERESPFGMELANNIQQVDEEIKRLTASIGNHKRNVENYPAAIHTLGAELSRVGGMLKGFGGTFSDVGNVINSVANTVSAYAEGQKQLANIKKLSTDATIKQTLAQKALNTAMKIAPYMWIISAIETVVSIVMKLVSVFNKANKEQELYNKSLEDAAKSIEGVNASIMQNINVLKSASTSDRNRKKSLDELNKITSELGVSFNDVNQAQQWWIDNGGKVIEMQLKQAQASQIAKMYAEEWAKNIKLQKDYNDNLEELKNSSKYKYVPFAGYGFVKDVFDAYFIKDKIDEAKDNMQSFKDFHKKIMEEVEKMQKELIKSMKEAGATEIVSNNVKEDTTDFFTKLKEYVEGVEKINIELNYDGVEKEVANLTKELEKLKSGVDMKIPGAAAYIDALEKLYEKKINDIYIKDADNKSKAEEQKLQNALLFLEKEYEAKRKAAAEDGKTSEDLAQLKINYEKDVYDTTVTYMKDLLSNANITEDRRKELSDKLQKIILNNNKKMTDAVIEGNDNMAKSADEKSKAFEKAWKEGIKAVADFASEIVGVFNEIMQNAISGQLKELKHQKDVFNEYYDKQQESLDNAIMSEQRRTMEEKRLADEKAAKEKELAQQELELRQKQAKYDKAAALIQAQISMAMGVVNAMNAGAQFGLAAPVMIPVLTGIATATGLAQIALIAAKQLPKYEKGGENISGWGLWGEKQPEIAVNKTQGIMFATEPTVTKFDPNTTIFPSIKEYINAANNRNTETTVSIDYEELGKHIRMEQHVNLDSRGLANIITGQGNRNKYVNRKFLTK
jgi:DNA repair exonuclease SbcCD ATPase subunit